MLPLSDLRHSTSFRLALMFAGMFGAASLVFATTIFLMASHFLSGNPDERMRAEAASFDTRPGADTYRRLDQHSVDDVTGRRPFGLFDASGRRIAGNLDKLPDPRPPLESMFETRVHTAQENTLYRSVLHRLPNGNLIVISRNIEELAKFRNELLEATLAGLGLLGALGIGGGIVIGVGSLRRLDNMTHAIERITRGELADRLPTRGTQDDLDRLARVINSMLDRIERLMGEVKGVCDSIAHDLRTPLTRLLGTLERASRRNLSAQERRVEIDAAITEVGDMLRTFDALLRISEIEDGARRAAFRELDLAQVARDAIEHFEPVADARGIAIALESSEPGPEPLTMMGDADLIFEALANLLDNAIKFSPAGGEIAVRIDPGPNVMVSDRGPGIAPADRDTVVQRFRRGTSSRETPGNGLGLPLVAAIAQLHGLVLRIVDRGPGCQVVLAPAGGAAL